MKIKKNLVAATAAVLAAGMALAGCGSSNGGSGDVQKTADGKVKITMWHGFSEADGKTGSNTGSTGLYWWVTSQVGDSEKLPGIYEFFKFYNNHDNQVKWSLGSAYPPNNKTVTADELSDRPLIAKISQYTDNSYIGIAGLKGGFGDIAASLDTLTQNTVRTGDDIQGLLDQAESSISGYLDEYAE